MKVGIYTCLATCFKNEKYTYWCSFAVCLYLSLCVLDMGAISYTNLL